MEPSGFDEANGVLGPPRGATEDEVMSLSVWRGRLAMLGMSAPVNAVVSCWKPDANELELFKRTGRVYLIVLGDTMPPACLVMGGKPDFAGVNLPREERG